MQMQGKLWGRTSPVFNKNNVEIHRFEAKEDGFCSEHKHHAKYNMFLVESGRLEITCWKDPSGKPDCTVVEAGQTCVVGPGMYHMFRAVTDCVVYEIYWVELLEDDIFRRSHGGVDK